MQRRDFVKNGAKLALGIGIGLNLGFNTIRDWYDDEQAAGSADLATISPRLEADFKKLVIWLKENGWAAYLHDALGVNFDLKDAELKKELVKKLDNDRLTALRHNDKAGYDDFSGERLVQPGFPAYSLFFHTLASPRVRPQGIKAYPALAQIDLLENYIYALCSWKQLKSVYGITTNEDLVFAVFAYEYRPAFKTPHHAYADVVYSRTGIARVGDEPLHYDSLNRCFTNTPADAGREKHVATTPARYGLFLARKVSNGSISLLTTGTHKGADSKDDRNDGCKTFLQPVRKIFNDDLLVGGSEIEFTETHKSVKLEKLVEIRNVTILHNLKPTTRTSKHLIVQCDKTRNTGSSFLVISKPEGLIRPAQEGSRTLFFKVPHKETTEYDNRFFTALSTQKVEDVELLDGNNDLGRIYNRYADPRNQPMFVNITNEADDTLHNTFHAIPKGNDSGFETKVNDGNYYAPLFEDSLCDGKVSAHVATLNLQKLKGLGAHCLPAFSIVTAPDFFPQVDPLDLVSFDLAPGNSNESNFYEGGVASLATARIKPNPKMIDTDADKTSDTYLAVLSGSLKNNTGISPEMVKRYKDPVADRGYDISGFLPDVASSVFAPGWDVTYCSIDNTHDIYIGTEGLGSPFIEDMKFCSALNGMWPATSPDAARTYQGGLEVKFRNPTAVPLLDVEIGICADSPAGSGHACTGWDGEQGPYLQQKDNKWKVNFTDVGRADAVSNALNGTIDMSKLRKLRAAELISRMQCLKLCIHTLPTRNFNDELYKRNTVGYTYLWLVSAEKVNWGAENAAALGIPAQLVGSNKNWISSKENAKISGEGYLYIFANTVQDSIEEPEHNTKYDHIELKDEVYDPKPEPRKKEWTSNPQRRLLDCEEIYVCQVTNDPTSKHKIAWTEVKNGRIHWNVV